MLGHDCPGTQQAGRKVSMGTEATMTAPFIFIGTHMIKEGKLQEIQGHRA